MFLMSRVLELSLRRLFSCCTCPSAPVQLCRARKASAKAQIALRTLTLSCLYTANVNHVSACRGAHDLAYVTALGPSDACANACKVYKGADRCGGNYAISLYRLTNVQYDQGAGVCHLWCGMWSCAVPNASDDPRVKL